VLIMGHRGARYEAPENTLPGIELALSAGVGAVEIDVHLSQDGALVVIHDETLERTTNGTGRVAEHTLSELRALDAGDGAQVPTLAEVLELTLGRAELFVEVKAPGCEEAIVREVRAKSAEHVLVKAFDHRISQRVKELAPDLRVGCLLYGRPVDPVGLVRAAGADFLSVSVGYLDEALVLACHAGDVAVCAWNCNDPQKVETFRDLGVDWLGTDVPTLLLSPTG
jgi:glycerophosphoryl diester phosphodiesterase